MVAENDPSVAFCVNCTCRFSVSQLRSSATDGEGDQQVSGLHFKWNLHDGSTSDAEYCALKRLLYSRKLLREKSFMNW